VAIKQLLVNTQENIDEFLNEVVIISGVKHQNVVKLKGCCLRDNKKLLVYEYLENGIWPICYLVSFLTSTNIFTLKSIFFSFIFVSNHIH
jgi:hypothetical protein